jgi:hypothetical protein
VDRAVRRPRDRALRPLRPWVHRYASLGFLLVFAALLVYQFKMRDRFDDRLGDMTMGRYLRADGLCFMPLIRVVKKKDAPPHAEVSLYYQNRFSGVCEAVVHLRPRDSAFFSHVGATDVHFAFRAAPGAFGVVHQPVGVADEHQGEPVEAQLAAMVRWPRSRGEQLRRKRGMPVGTFDVDWALAYRQSRHELCGEIELHDPVVMHLTMPQNVNNNAIRSEFTNETIEAMLPAS